MTTTRAKSIRPKSAVILGVAGAAVIALAGCSPAEEASTAPNTNTTTVSSHDHPDMSGQEHTSGEHNQADVQFNQMMIPHHQQALAMAELVPTRTQNPDVIALATRIKDAQQPEIDAMTARLKGWGVEVSSGMDHMGHGGMPGMMGDAEMTAMQNANGAAFDKLWLEGMIRHHEGAVAMANAELADGKDSASKELAQQIKDSQAAEIAEMKKLLGIG